MPPGFFLEPTGPAADSDASVANVLAGVEFVEQPADGLGRLPAHRSQPYTGRADA